MPRNGSGTYTLPAGNPVVTGTVISSTVQNNTTSDIATALTNSLAKDGQTTPTANLPMGGFKLTGLGTGSASTDSLSLGQAQNGAFLTLASVAGTDTITAAASPTLTAYANGQRFSFISAGANTGTSVTINIDSLGAKNITKLGATALAIGDIPASAKVLIEYDGTQFQLIGLAAQSAASLSAGANLADGVTATTQSVADNSTKVATTAYADRYGSRIQPISASVAANAMTLTVNPTVVDFRSGTLGSGTVTTVAIPAAINTVISSGSTGGTTSGVQSDIVVAVINNAGTAEVAWANMNAGIDLSETTLISTTAEGGAGGADSGTTWYSTTARANVPYRILGFVRSTQATAGTWATAPSLIQGFGGNSYRAIPNQNIGLVKLNSGTVSAASSLDIILTTYVPLYNNFKIVVTDVAPVTDIVAWYGRVSTNGGSSYDSGASNYGYIIIGTSTAGTAYSSQGADTQMRFSPAAIGNLSTEGIRRFEADISNVNDAAGYCDFSYRTSFIDNTGAISYVSGSCMRAAAQDTDAFQFYFSSGNITTANWVLYGWN